MSAQDTTGAVLVNHWQRGVPVYREPVLTRPFLFFAALAALGLCLALVRFFSPLGPFSGMNDAYAWGIWKTFNVMTVTALGSGRSRWAWPPGCSGGISCTWSCGRPW